MLQILREAIQAEYREVIERRVFTGSYDADYLKTASFFVIYNACS